jgi:hypothetical protein
VAPSRERDALIEALAASIVAELRARPSKASAYSGETPAGQLDRMRTKIRRGVLDPAFCPDLGYIARIRILTIVDLTLAEIADDAIKALDRV